MNIKFTTVFENQTSKLNEFFTSSDERFFQKYTETLPRPRRKLVSTNLNKNNFFVTTKRVLSVLKTTRPWFSFHDNWEKLFWDTGHEAVAGKKFVFARHWLKIVWRRTILKCSLCHKRKEILATRIWYTQWRGVKIISDDALKFSKDEIESQDLTAWEYITKQNPMNGQRE